MVEFFDLEQVVRYVELLNKATTAAKVGFYLSQHQDVLMVDDETVATLKTMIPKQPHYMDRGVRTGGDSSLSGICWYPCRLLSSRGRRRCEAIPIGSTRGGFGRGLRSSDPREGSDCYGFR